MLLRALPFPSAFGLFEVLLSQATIVSCSFFFRHPVFSFFNSFQFCFFHLFKRTDVCFSTSTQVLQACRKRFGHSLLPPAENWTCSSMNAHVHCAHPFVLHVQLDHCSISSISNVRTMFPARTTFYIDMTGLTVHVMWLCCCAVHKFGAMLLTTRIATQGVWTTRSCPTPRARDPGLQRPPSHALNLNSSWQPVRQ